jgi:drug/metabolite transporter (DMT)-like permease
VSVFVVLRAVSIGNVSLVGAMSGTGLVSLTIFSALVMGEEIKVPDLAGISLIVVASVALGALGNEDRTAAPKIGILFLYLAAVGAFGLSLWVGFGRRRGLAGVVIGGFAGALGGFSPVFQKVSTDPAAQALSFATSWRGISGLDPAVVQADTGFPGDLVTWGARVLLNPYTLVWVLLSLVSMVVLQFSYRWGRAIQVIPAFSVCFLVVPVFGGVIGFGESLHPLQWAAVAVVLAGVALLTFRQNPTPRSPAR